MVDLPYALILTRPEERETQGENPCRVAREWYDPEKVAAGTAETHNETLRE
jgi:hypothetical protein